ncbi:helix-turn-helix domain-containing protein [Lactobacillus helveticus]|uniref:helix-turn-helix domain-containing protein n=1 Tax=Lactobacillus helveticus TaxID=1587 RepID=UPI0021823994|nr:helix-turn-helix transcriptional regulator [Lactobacillus helveticus]
MNIGKKLKYLRLSLGLNSKQFAHGVVNETYLAYVENEEGKIRSKELIAILNQNHLSIIAFLADFGNIQSDSFFMRIKQMMLFLIKMYKNCSNQVILARTF